MWVAMCGWNWALLLHPSFPNFWIGLIWVHYVMRRATGVIQHHSGTWFQRSSWRHCLFRRRIGCWGTCDWCLASRGDVVGCVNSSLRLQQRFIRAFFCPMCFVTTNIATVLWLWGFQFPVRWTIISETASVAPEVVSCWGCSIAILEWKTSC